MELKLIRSIYTERATAGELYAPAGWRCYTLEDTVRGYGIKVPGSTAIPAGRYLLTVTHSERFGRDMVMISNCDNGDELSAGGIAFKGLRLHGGNTHEHTDGCILVAKNRISDSVIQGTQEAMITELVRKATGDSWIEIINRV